jgi:sulfatase maturation enzyme AslB (radical SAM superfamily)
MGKIRERQKDKVINKCQDCEYLDYSVPGRAKRIDDGTDFYYLCRKTKVFAVDESKACKFFKPKSI